MQERKIKLRILIRNLDQVANVCHDMNNIYMYIARISNSAVAQELLQSGKAASGWGDFAFQEKRLWLTANIRLIELEIACLITLQ